MSDDDMDDKDVDNNVDKSSDKEVKLSPDNLLDDSLFEIPPHFVEDPSRWDFKK